MFSPLSGTIEDAATGSAATPLAALLLSLGTADKARYDITQGVEMGRPSLLACAAWRAPDGIRASVGGGCVPVLKGEDLAIAGRRRNPRAGSGRRRRRPGDRCAGSRRDRARGRPACTLDRHLAGVVRRDADLLAGLEAAGIVGVDSWSAPGSAALAMSSASLALMSLRLPLPSAFMRCDQATISGSRSSGAAVSPSWLWMNHTGL